MAIPTVSASNNVNELLRLAKGHIFKQHQIAPWSYDELTYQYQGGGLGGGTSENHDVCAACVDLTSAVYKWPMSAPLSEIVKWIEALLSTRIYLQKEGSLLSNIYFWGHTFEPGLVILWACETLAKTDARFVPLAAGIREWLRAGLGWAALVALPVKLKSWTDADRAALKVGPGLAVARGVPDQYAPPVTVAATGCRGWDLLKDGSWLNPTAHGAVWPLGEFGLGIRVKRNSWAAELLKQMHGWSPNLFTAAEQATITNAIGGDLVALDHIEKNLILDWMPMYPVEVIRAAGGVTTVILEAKGGATSAVVAKTAMTDGTVYALGTDSPWRESRNGSYNRGHKASVDLAARIVTAQAVLNKTPNYDNPIVRCPVAPGEVYFHRVYSKTGIVNKLAPVNPPAEPVPIPVPVPAPVKPKRRSWFRRFLDWLGL